MTTPTPPEIVFYEAFDEEAEALRRHLPAGLPARFEKGTVQESGDRVPPAPLISIRTQSLVPAGWSGRLRGILSRSTGYDHLLAYRAQVAPPGPDLGYLPLYCHRAVAEQALLLWMALLRRLPRQVRQFGAFERDGITGRECRGRTLVVAGVGNIGHEVVDIGRGLGMTVLGVDPVQRWPDVEYVAYDEAAARAEVVVVCMNLTSDSRGFFNAERLGQLRPGAVLVNVARGELVSAPALLSALEAGRLAGVGLDVYDQEPALAVALRRGEAAAPTACRAVMALARREDVLCTPHNAFNTHESVERKAAQSVQQALHHREHGRFLWPVP